MRLSDLTWREEPLEQALAPPRVAALQATTFEQVYPDDDRNRRLRRRIGLRLVGWRWHGVLGELLGGGRRAIGHHNTAAATVATPDTLIVEAQARHLLRVKQ